MNIYLVTRWGNDQGGVNEVDTSFIVLASSFHFAALVVDERLMKTKKTKAAAFCQRITELGITHAVAETPVIVLGPIVENAIAHDSIGISNEKKWVRDSIDEGWLKFTEYYD